MELSCLQSRLDCLRRGRQQSSSTKGPSSACCFDQTSMTTGRKARGTDRRVRVDSPYSMAPTTVELVCMHSGKSGKWGKHVLSTPSGQHGSSIE
jgi:hypothetical protein